MSQQPQSDLLVQIRDLIYQHFDLEEFHDLCFRLGIRHENLRGQKLETQIRELVLRISRQGRLVDLLSFCAHLRPHVEWPDIAQSVTLDTTPPAYTAPKRNPRQIFISHARQDAEFAHRLTDDLDHRGWEIWIAPDSIRPGESWVSAINRGLAESGTFLLLLSPDSVNSAWVQRETDAAIGLQHQNKIRLIPLEIKASSAPPLWQAFQWISFQNSYKDGLERLLRELQPTSMAEVDNLYQQLQTAQADKDWARVQTTAAKISGLYPGFRNIDRLLTQARQATVHEQASFAKVTEQDKKIQLEQGRYKAIKGQLQRIPVLGWVSVAVLGIFIFFLVSQFGIGGNRNDISATPTTTQIAVQAPAETKTPTPTASPTIIRTATIGATSPPTLAPNPLLPPVSSQLGVEWQRPKDGMVMVYVPAPDRPFVLESGLDTPNASYWIDKYEVSNIQYQLCVNAGICRPALFAEDERFNGNNHPVVGVSWFDAIDYVAWLNETLPPDTNWVYALPTESEWEYAAVGNAATAYTWGDVFDGTLLNFCDTNCPNLDRDNDWDDGFPYTAPVGSFPAGSSWVGAMDMSGNVWEWTSSWLEDETWHVVRGGSWYHDRENVGTTTSLTAPSDRRYNRGGFRLITRPLVLEEPVPQTTPVSHSNGLPSNAQLGYEWKRPQDEMGMVYVPSPNEPFVLESGLEAPTAGYWIDKHPVTNVQYQLCVEAGICEPAEFIDDPRFNGDNHPVVGVSWIDANTYSSWVGGMLPTESEWEYAAVGENATVYPWGNEFDGTRLNFCDVNCPFPSRRTVDWDDGYIYTSPVDAYSGGTSWVGALDMVGNVWEWTASWSDASLTQRIVKGGAWGTGESDTRVGNSSSSQPPNRNNSFGFRVIIRDDSP